MKVLLDAHTVYWAVDNPSKLSAKARTTLQNPANELLLSAGTLWELAIKVGLGKLVLSMPFKPWITQAIADLNLVILPISISHAETYAGLALHHRDPFDRLLVAQAQTENVPLASADAIFDQYSVPRIW